MARCTDCTHFSLCDYNSNIAGDSKIKLFFDKGAEKCSFYTPTADVAEVKHGEWIGSKHISQECSVCGFGIDDDVSYEMYHDCYRKPKYCPECGAKMKGVSDDNC